MGKIAITVKAITLKKMCPLYKKCEKKGDDVFCDGVKIENFLKDSGLPALIKDPADFDSIYVVMPMKG